MSRFTDSKRGFPARLSAGLLRFAKSPDAALIPAFLLPFCLVLILLRLALPTEGNALLLLPGLGEDQLAFYEALRRAMAGEGSLLYSFAAGLGNAFYGTYFHHLASPFSYFIAIFGEKDLAAALVMATALKAGFAGLTFAFYLRRAKNTSGAVAMLSACLYAVSSFSAVFAFLPAMGDAMILLPLVLLGLHRLIHEKRYLLFTVSFFFALATNPSAGLVVGLFAVLVFFFTRAGEEEAVYNPMEEKRHFLHSLLRFLLFGALSFLLAAFALLPALHHLALNGVGDLGAMDHENVMNFDFMLLLLKLLPASYDTVASGGAPFVYCGTLALLLVPLYFFRSSLSARRRIADFALLFVVFLLLLTRPTDWFMNGFSLPEVLDYRFAYLLVFLLCTMGADALDRKEAYAPRTVFSLAAILTLAVILMQYLADSVRLANGDPLPPVDDLKSIWLAIFCILLYAFFLLALSQMPKWKTVITLGLAFFVSAELVLSGAAVLESVNKETPLLTVEKAEEYQENILGGAAWLKENAASPLFRTDLSEYPKSQAILNGLGGYGLETDGSLPYSMKFLGGGYLTSSPVFSAFYGARYAVSSARPAGNWSVVHTEEDYTVWENRYALPIVFSASAIPVSPGGNYADRLNSLLHQLTGTTVDFFRAVDKSAVVEDLGNRSFYLTVPESGDYYLELNNVKTRAGEDRVLCNSRTVFEGGAVSTVANTLIRLGTFQKGDTVTVRLELANSLPDNTEALFTCVTTDSYEIFDSLAAGGMTVTEATDGKIKGTVSVAADQTCVFTTIPYTQSWKVFVDGRPVAAEYGMSGLLCFSATPGEHEIVLEYAPAYITVGIAVSCVSILLLGGYVAVAVLQKKGKLPSCRFLRWLLPQEKNED